jgi:predicted AAA+ superfamily ATPase
VTNLPESPLGRLLPRHATAAVAAALQDTRVVLVNGARQSGKSTLVRLISGTTGATYRTLDQPVALRAALEDPEGFVAVDGPMVIDEVQRAPELLLAIKADVDARPVPGRFLMTGSARVLSLRSLPDALPGRMETIELWPLSQGEIDGSPDGFIDAMFSAGSEFTHRSSTTRADYAERIVRGGFPEAVARSDQRRRRRFLDAYVRDLVAREVTELSEIERLAEMRTLIRLLAARSGQLLVSSALASAANLPNRTAARYLELLEQVFLIKRIPAWSRNLSTRVTGTSKVAMVDSGIAATLLGFDAQRLLEPGAPLRPVLEGFVLMELARQLTWSEQEADLFHYRTRDQVEVDVVLENRRGQVIAVEVKAASTVRAEDFRGLRHLANRLGRDFLVGAVLYTGTETLPFGPQLRAIPLSAVWEAAPLS